jgi:hypothetical protein
MVQTLQTALKITRRENEELQRRHGKAEPLVEMTSVTNEVGC